MHLEASAPIQSHEGGSLRLTLPYNNFIARRQSLRVRYRNYYEVNAYLPLRVRFVSQIRRTTSPTSSIAQAMARSVSVNTPERVPSARVTRIFGATCFFICATASSIVISSLRQTGLGFMKVGTRVLRPSEPV